MRIKKKSDDYIVGATRRRFFVKADKPGLVINQNGIEDHSTYFGIGFIAWDDIEEIVMHESDSIYIGIFPYDLKTIKENASFVQKVGIFINSKVAIKAPFNMSVINLREPLPHVLAQILCYIPDGQEDKLGGFSIPDLIEDFPEIIELIE